MPLHSIAQLASLSDATLDALTAALRAHEFDAGVTVAISQIAPMVSEGARIPVVRWHLERRPEPGLRLALLLCYRGELPRDEVERLLGAGIVRELLGAGVLLRQGERLGCPFRLEPFLDTWILADSVLSDRDSVMPSGPTTQQLARIFPGKIEGSVLDVGCGPGGLAIVAAKRGAQRVLGVDINERAVAMARFNARLNRVDAEFRAGDLFEPAAGERFDLVVAQPPFIFQSEHTPEVVFMHAGPRGDTLTLRVLREVPASLSPRGEALVLADVALLENEELSAWIEDRLGDIPLRLLALHSSGPTPEVQAMMYAAFLAGDLGPRYLAIARDSIAHAESLGLSTIRHALFVARPGKSGDRLDAVAIPVREVGAATPTARARLWSATRVAGAVAEELAARRVRVAPDAEWVSRRPRPEGEQAEHRVRFGEGWPALEQIVPDEGVVLASLLESSPNLEQAVRGYAERCDATPDEVRAPVLEYIRAGLKNGLLVVEDDDGG